MQKCCFSFRCHGVRLITVINTMETVKLVTKEDQRRLEESVRKEVGEERCRRGTMPYVGEERFW